MAVHGYERASVALIAKEAGLASGLVHHHFESKAAILMALVDGLRERAESRIEARLTRAETAAERIDAILDALLAQGADADPAAVQCWAMIAADAVKSDEVRAAYAGYVDKLTDQLARAIVEACHDEGRSGEGARAMAGALVAMTEGYFALAVTVPNAIPAGSAASMAKRSVRGLIAAQPRKKERP